MWGPLKETFICLIILSFGARPHSEEMIGGTQNGTEISDLSLELSL